MVFFEADPMVYFQKWGYGTVKAENVKESDIAVYLNCGTGKPLIKHLGVMLGNGLVKSKMSWKETWIAHHKLEDVPAQFGNLVVFMRKKT